ncbi:HPP family protein [Aliigemmobacter aestuarii]|nr:HPP family protein [Gemmobacter aestuarii]
MRLPLRVLRGLGPAMGRPRLREMMRASAGAAAGLLACLALAHLLTPVDTAISPAALLFAPLGATAFLVFAVPNSPLSQPWSAIVGNTASALIALTVIRVVGNPALSAALSVGGGILAMMSLRAIHPPAAAVALLISLNAGALRDTGYAFAWRPVMLDTTLLVAFAVLWNRATGRIYPFRQPPTEAERASAPDRRLGLSADDLAAILQRMHLGANIGPEDLARVIGAAQAETTARHLGGITCGEIMSRNVFAVRPSATLDEIGAMFRSHPVKALPVTDAAGHLCGTVNQSRYIKALTDAPDATAERIMRRDMATVAPDDPLAPLIAILAAGGQANVPVTEDGKLVGVITRTDLIAALAAEFGH